MKTYKLSSKNEENFLAKCGKVLRSGGIIISPTDTVYGILGDATDSGAVKKIFAMKKRPEEMAFPIFVKDAAAARKFAYISDAKAVFLGKIWPGPLTVVFEHKEKLSKVLTGGKPTIAIRVPNYDFINKLLDRVDFPLVQTSANISGKPPAKNVEEVKSYFTGTEQEPDLIIDGGESVGTQSTVIDLTKNNPIILRTGTVSKKELDRLFESVR